MPTETRRPKDLTPHPLNAKVYRDSFSPDLLESIRERGVIDALTITWDGRIISGHRRWLAACECERDAVPVTVSDLTDELEIELAVLEANRQREKTNEQKAREVAERHRIEAEKAKRRQGDAGTANLPTTSSPPGRGTKAEENGESWDKAGEAVGWSGDTASAAAEAVETADELLAAGEKVAAEEIVETLKTKGAKPARKKARAAKPKEKPKAKTPSKSKATFNLTNDKIEWARWTWNPVTGCKHGCKYCYAREIAESDSRAFPEGFTPRLIPERLAAPDRMAVPTIDPATKQIIAADQKTGWRTVFVCSMGDLFGKWVPDDWVLQVFDAVSNAPDWNFLFLTKNPERMAGLDWPKNAWAGTTVDEQSRVQRAEEAFANVDATVRFLSCEPLSERLDFTQLERFHWVIVGGRSGTKRMPAMQPDWEWVGHLVSQARAAKCKVYLKPNLVIPKEYPNDRGSR